MKIVISLLLISAKTCAQFIPSSFCTSVCNCEPAGTAGCNFEHVFMGDIDSSDTESISTVQLIVPSSQINIDPFLRNQKFWRSLRNVTTIEFVQGSSDTNSLCDDNLIAKVLDDDHLKNNLETLMFTNVKIICQFPSVLKHFKRLNSITYRNTHLNTLSFYGMNLLETVIVINNKLKYVAIGGLQNLPMLRRLDIIDEPNLDIRENALESVSGTLKTLTVRNCGLTDQKLRTIGTLRYLETLDLSNNKQYFNLRGVGQLNDQFPALKTLNLTGNHIQTLPENVFKDMEQLQNIYMDHTNITEFSIAWLHKVPKLKLFSAKYSKSLSTVQYDDNKPIKEMSNFTKIDFSDSSVQLLKQSVVNWVECHQGNLILSNVKTIDCSNTETLKWMAFVYKNGTKGKLNVDSTQCNRNLTLITQTFNKFEFRDQKINCRGTKILNYFGNGFMLLLVVIILLPM